MRRLLSFVGWLTFAAIVLATAVVIAIDVGFQRDRLRALAVAALADELGIEVAVERIEGRASRGLELRGVRLGPEAAPLAEIDRLRGEWRIWRWLAEDERRIDRIEIRGAAIHLERDAEGRWRTLDDVLDRLEARTEAEIPETDAPAVPIVVDALSLEDSSIEILPTQRAPDASGAAPLPVDRIVLSVEGRASDYRSTSTDGLPIESAALEFDLVEATREGASLPLLEAAKVGFELTRDRRLRAAIAASGPGLTLDADVDGTIAAPGPLRFVLRADDVARLAPWIPEAETLRGYAYLEGSVSGFRVADAVEIDPAALVADLTIDATLEGLPAVRGRSLPSGALTIRGQGQLQEGRLRVDEALVEHRRGLRAELSGTVTRERLDGVELSVSVANVGLWTAALAPEAGTIGGEGLDLRADLDGPVDAPVGTLTARGRGLQFRDLPATDLEIALERAGGEAARLRALAWEPGRAPRDVGANDAPFRLDARIDPEERTARVEAETDGAFVTRTELLPEPVAGRFDVVGTARLAEKGLEFDARLHGTDVVVDETPVGTLEVAARTRTPATRQSLALELLTLEAGVGSAASPRAHLERTALVSVDDSGRWRIADFALALGFAPELMRAPDGESAGEGPRPGIEIDARGRARQPQTAAVSIRGVPVEAIAQLVDAVSPVTGRLSLEARFETKDGFVHSEGSGGIAGPTISGQAFDTASLSWTSDSDATLASLSLVTAQVVPVDVTARFPLPPIDPQEDLAAVLEGTTFVAKLDGIDLGLLAASLPRTLRDPRGRLRGRVEGRIENGRPRLHGRFDVEEAGITVPLLRRRFAPIDGHAILDDRRLELRALRLGSDEAGARLQAVVDLDPDSGLPIDAELVANRLPVSRSPLLHADVDGRIEIAGSLSEPRITGRLTLPGLQVRVPAAQDPLLREIRLTASAEGSLVEPTEGSNDFVTSSYVDVKLDVPGDARVRGQGAQLFVKGSARLSSRPGEALRVFGEGEVVHGTYTLQGRRFQVRRGSVQLVGDRDVDPVLDIEARLPTGDIVAIVDVTGRLSSPIVRLRSEPSRSEQDVLSYLLFGRPAEEVGASQSGSMNAAAARLVAGVAERELREVLGDAMPVDSIEIGADDEGNTSELGFGKYLQPNLYLRYVHTLGDEPADRVGVEYRVNDLISVGSSVSTTGDAGLDLILRHDF